MCADIKCSDILLCGNPHHTSHGPFLRAGGWRSAGRCLFPVGRLILRSLLTILTMKDAGHGSPLLTDMHRT